MSKEGLKPSDFYAPSALILLGAMSLFAFSLPTLRKIRERDKVDVIDGSIERLQGAHIDHSRANPLYDHPSNGRLLSAKNHYLDHVTGEGVNGLSALDNLNAKKTIWKILTPAEKAKLPPPE